MHTRLHSCYSRLLLSALLTTSFIFLYSRQSFFAPENHLRPIPHHDEHEEQCDPAVLDGLDGIFVTLKTGASDARETVPVHLNTTLRCVPHYAIYSDFEEEIAGHHVHDVLDEIDSEIRSTHPEFEYYRRLQEGGREAFSAEEVNQWSSTENTPGGRDTPGWKLDKWKFLPLAEKALRARPEADWYVIFEGDSYIHWSGLLDWLSRFEPSEPYYLGIQMIVDGIIFAYGGAGTVISRPALEMLVAHRSKNLKSLDKYTAESWAGDCVLGKALLDAGVGLFFSWPNLYTEQPKKMDFNMTLVDEPLWCYHAASYHHLTPTDVLELSEFMKTHEGSKSSLRHGDVFEGYILPQLQPERDDWDNLSDSNQPYGASSIEACRELCRSQPECMQYSYGQGCRLSKVINLGYKHSGSHGGPITSGWMMDRVESFVNEMNTSCDEQGWLLP